MFQKIYDKGDINCIVLAIAAVCMYFGLLVYALACFSVMTEQNMKREYCQVYADVLLEFEEKINGEIIKLNQRTGLTQEAISRHRYD